MVADGLFDIVAAVVRRSPQDVDAVDPGLCLNEPCVADAHTRMAIATAV